MANELRKRQLAIGGLVEDNPLTAGATTLTSAALAAISGGVTATEYMAVVLDPDGVDGAPEVAYVTALTGGAGSATIVRGQEGTTGRQHVASTPWVHAATLVDVPLSGDQAWGGDLGFDYEFEANSASLPSGWSWINQGSATYEEKFGAGKLTKAAEGGVHTRGIVRSLSGAASAWTATAKVSFPSLVGKVNAGFLVLRQASNQNIIGIRCFNGHDVDITKADDDDWTGATTVSGPDDFGTLPDYVRIVKNSSTNWDFLASHNGISWVSLLAAYDLSGHLTPDQIGFVQYAQDKSGEFSFAWFRLR